MLVSILVVLELNVSAQDVIKTNPKFTKLLADTAGSCGSAAYNKEYRHNLSFIPGN
jgi:hypothetical protein